jgi:ribosomal protein L37E
MSNRFQDTGQTIHDFGNEFLVRCPRCGQLAHVIRQTPLQSTTSPSSFDSLFDPRRLACTNCGYSQVRRENDLSIGAPIDWYFRLPLWLQTPCRGRILWAYNAAHLRFLEDYIGADLRERLPNPHTNKSLASRLPSWMKSAKNRDEVLKGIARLKDLVDAAT